MPQVESHRPGTPSWVDLQSSDPERARDFYAALLGWSYEVGGEESGFYAMARKGDRLAAGVGGLSPGNENAPSSWTVSFATEQVESSVERVVANGGTVVAPPMDVFDLGRMAMCTDPTGALFGFWQPGTHRGMGVVDEPGAFAWCEGLSRDVTKARAFYGAALGLTEKPMEGMEYWTLQDGERPAFGLMAMPRSYAPKVPSHWNVYFRVEDVDAAASLVMRLGGAVHWAPSNTPFGRLVSAADPMGAGFMLLSRPR